MVASGAAAAVLFVLVGLGSAALSATLTETGRPAYLAVVLVSGITFALFVGATATIQQLFIASDLDLVLAAPVSHRTLYLVRLSESALTGLPGAAFILASLAGYALGTAPAALFYPAALLVTVLVMLLSGAVSLLVIMLMVRIAPPRVVQGAVVLITTVFGALVWVLSQLAVRDVSGGIAGRLDPLAHGWTERTSWAPTTWAAWALTAAADGRPLALAGYLALLAGAVLVVGALAGVVFHATFITGRGRLSESRPAGRLHAERVEPQHAAGVTAAGGGQRGRSLLLPPPVLAIALKDLRLLRRDIRHLSSFVFPLVMGLFFASQWDRTGGGFWLSLVAMVYVLLLVGPQFSVPALGRESRGYAVLRAAPVTAGQIIAAKALAGIAPLLALLWLVILGVAVWHRQPPGELIALLAVAAWLTTGTVTSDTAIGTLDPKFDSEDPKSTTGCLAWAISLTINGSFVASSVGLVTWLTLVIEGDVGVSTAVAAAVALVLIAVTLCAAGGIALLVHHAARRLQETDAP